MAINRIADQNRWDKFIDDSSYGLIYHKWGFLKLVEKYTGYEFLPYGIYKGEQLICVFPLFYKKIFSVKLLFSPPPQSGIPYLGPVLCKDYDSMKQDKKESTVNLVAQEIDTELKRIAPNYFLTIMVPDLLDIRPFLWLNYQIAPSYTYMINLKPELEDIKEGFTSLCKQCIRKGEDLKCQLVRGNDTSILTDLLTERYNEQGLNLMIDPDYLQEVLKTYPENLILQSLYDKDELVGSTLNQAYHRYLGWLGLPKPKNKKYTYANEFMIWQLIQQAKSLGFTKFEMNGANKQNLCQFRTKFNPKLEIYFTLTKKDTLGKLAEAFYFRVIKTRAFAASKRQHGG